MKNRLKDLRKRHQWSQADLARELQVSRQAVNGFESGKFDPSLEMAFKIANLFDVALENIFIYEAKHSMQTLLERVTHFLGFDFGFERFTDKAINAVKFAQGEAVRTQDSQVEPKHLLAGLLADTTTVSAHLLQSSGATLNIEINEHSFKSREAAKLSSKSKFIMEMALQIVRLKGKKTIGTEHLLWGLVRLAESEPAELNDVFQHYGIDINTLNNQLIEAV
jgi:putative transcriptional regulator